MKNKNFLALVLLSTYFTFSSFKSQAAEVGKASKTQAIIHLNGDSVEVGKTYFVIDPSTLKKKAQIKILKISGDKAKAAILKGKASQGFQLVLKNSTNSKNSSSEDSSEDSASEDSGSQMSSKTLRSSWGILGSYIMNAMSAKRTASSVTSATNMTGSTFGLGAFYNYAFTSNMSLKFSGAYEQMQATGTIANPPGCGTGGTSCDATITYLSGYGHINYYIAPGAFSPFLGVGFGFLFPMSKSSTALNADKISMNQVINLAVGMDIKMGRDAYLPLIFEYNYFSPSDTVTASMMMLKAGWGWDL